MLSAAEKEAIGLSVATEALDAIVNRALLQVPEDLDAGQEIEVRFHDREHQQLFLIRLLDFAREEGDGALTGVRGTCLDVLQEASKSSGFGDHEGARALASAADALDRWLATETSSRLWLPTLGLDADLRVQRWELLHIAANDAKHNLSRLTRVSRRIREILARSGYKVDLESCPLAIDDFREHLREDYFVYYGTWLAELANNVRWGIHDYLREEFFRAYIAGKGGAYTYRFPDQVQSDLGREWYSRLMNQVRAGPYFSRFVGSRYLKRERLR